MTPSRLPTAVAMAIGCLGGASAQAQSIPLSPTAQASGALVSHEQGIDFVTIGAAGNAPWPGNGSSGDLVLGRGGVNYEYRIGRFEVTTAQWVEFFNAAYDRPVGDRLPNLIPPSVWGAAPTMPNTSGGLRWTVTAGNDMRPVGNIDWRMAAMYCNWLHNDKSTSRSAFLNGAYDVSTFGYTPDGRFTDQLTHNPGARYWIPTWDEWLKAAHYDPNKNGPGQGGWWTYSTTSDTLPAYGPPGQRVRLNGFRYVPDPNGVLAEVNAGWTNQSFPGFDPFGVLLGAYPTVQSPWGLLDAAGATSEWTEEPFYFAAGELPHDRLWEGSQWLNGGSNLDQVRVYGGDFPTYSGLDLGLRIATTVPAPGASIVAVWATSQIFRRKRNTHRGRFCGNVTRM